MISTLGRCSEGFPAEISLELSALSPAIVGGGDSTDIAVAYQKSPAVLTFEIPLPFTQYAVQVRNFEFIVPCRSRCGGVIIYRPLAIEIMEGI